MSSEDSTAAAAAAAAAATVSVSEQHHELSHVSDNASAHEGTRNPPKVNASKSVHSVPAQAAVSPKAEKPVWESVRDAQYGWVKAKRVEGASPVKTVFHLDPYRRSSSIASAAANGNMAASSPTRHTPSAKGGPVAPLGYQVLQMVLTEGSPRHDPYPSTVVNTVRPAAVPGANNEVAFPMVPAIDQCDDGDAAKAVKAPGACHAKKPGPPVDAGYHSRDDRYFQDGRAGIPEGLKEDAGMKVWYSPCVDDPAVAQALAAIALQTAYVSEPIFCVKRETHYWAVFLHGKPKKTMTPVDHKARAAALDAVKGFVAANPKVHVKGHALTIAKYIGRGSRGSNTAKTT